MKQALVVISALLAVILVVAALQSPHFAVARSMTIAAPDSVVFAQLNDFHRWEKWSPWAKLDPQMQQTYDGAAEGTGAKYAWAGNSKVGEGRMTITESTPSSLIRIDLEFLKPFVAHNRTEFTLAPSTGGTTVTWAMTGEKNFISKVLGLVMNMDQAIGTDFERGLTQLKAASEAEVATVPAPAPAT